MKKNSDNFGMPKMDVSSLISDSNIFSLNETEKKVLELIHEKWPTSALEIAEHLGENISGRKNQRKASSKYAYYLKKLIDKQLILSKRIGNALIVWPTEAEKLKVIKSILKEE